VASISKPTIGPPGGGDDNPLARGIKDWKIHGIKREIARNVNLSHGAFRTYVLLLGYVGKNCDKPFPSMERLAEELGCERTSVHNYILELEHAEIIMHTKGAFVRGRPKANEYEFVPDAQDKPCSVEDIERSVFHWLNTRCSKDSTHVVQNSDHKSNSTVLYGYSTV
jgi:DNA-binding transcriptional regulator YhcF (GntR family)